MAAKANMYAVSMGDRFFEIGQTVPVAILYAPHIRTNADKKIIPVGQYGAGHIGDFIMKVFHYQLGKVSQAISVPVFQAVNMLFFHCHLAPVMRSEEHTYELQSLM